MPVNSIFRYISFVLFFIIGCGAYLIDQSGEIVEAYNGVTTAKLEALTTKKEPNFVEIPVTDAFIKPYNILQTKPLPHCPEGFILANKRCHKRVK